MGERTRNRTTRERATIELGCSTAEQFDAWVMPAQVLAPTGD